MADFDKFISEEKKDKDKRGKDDDLYCRLMERYKRLRRDPSKRDEAQDAFDEAMDLRRNGDVSEKAKLGAAYL